MAQSFACLMAFIGLDHGIFWCLMNISNLTFTKMFSIPMLSVISPKKMIKTTNIFLTIGLFIKPIGKFTNLQYQVIINRK